MLVLDILKLIVLIYNVIVCSVAVTVLIKIAADLSSIQDYQSKEHAKEVADYLNEQGYVFTEAGKEFLKANK